MPASEASAPGATDSVVPTEVTRISEPGNSPSSKSWICVPSSAWVAATRISEAGHVMGPEERLTLDQALRAITIDAAYILGLEHEIGSIRGGKTADFTILEQDPYEVGAENLREIPIWGTVFEGRPHPIKRP